MRWHWGNDVETVCTGCKWLWICFSRFIFYQMLKLYYNCSMLESGPVPVLFTALIFAPALMRYSTQDGLQLSTALIRGVAPLRVGGSTEAPASTSNCMMSSCPAWQAWCRGVQLNWSHAFTSALWWDYHLGFIFIFIYICQCKYTLIYSL